MFWSLVYAVVGALAAAAAFPPYRLVPGAFFGVALLVGAAVRGHRRTHAAIAGLVYGGVFIGVLMSWMANLGREAISGLVLSQIGFYAVFAAVLWGFRKRPTWELATIATGGWAAMEFARARGPVGGLSWGGLGYPLGEWSALRDVAQFIGTSGLGVLVASVGAGLAVAGVRRQYRPLALAVAVFGAAGFIGWIVDAGPAGPPIRVAIVQGNSPCPGSSCPNERTIIFENHLDLTRALPADQFDLVAWPESSTGFGTDPLQSNAAAAAISAEASRLDAYMVIGGDRPAAPGFFFNSNLFYDRAGNLIDEYRKIHPVPFGEYVPMRSVIGDLLPVLSRVPLDMVRGERPVTVAMDFGGVGSVISYEASFARYTRDAVRDGAQLLVVASNEASYGRSPAAAQFIGMTRMRAAENGVDVVHGAVTGSSTLITDGGEVGETTDLYTADIVEGSVRMRSQGPTVYTRWGDWLAVAAMIAAATTAVWSAIRSRVLN